MSAEPSNREQVVALLEGGHAHMPFEAAVADFPMEAINQKPANVSYSPWALLEHMRLTQADILEFITAGSDYVEKQWPQDYWPPEHRQATPELWHETLAGFRRDHETLLTMAKDPSVPMSQAFEHALEYNLLRELLTVADHNAYHIGEFAILRQVMGIWPDR